MPKNIVFCADGTWNGPGEGNEAQEVAARPPADKAARASVLIRAILVAATCTRITQRFRGVERTIHQALLLGERPDLSAQSHESLPCW